MAVQTVRSLRMFYPKSPILVLDDLHWPMDKPVARKLVELGATYRKSEWERGKATKQRSHFTMTHNLSQLMAMDSWATECGLDILVKIDSDCVCTGPDVHLWLGDGEFLMATTLERSMVHGFCYSMRSRSLSKVARVVQAGKVKTFAAYEDVYMRNLFLAIVGREKVIDYQINNYTQRSFLTDCTYPDGGVTDEDREFYSRFSVVNFGWLNKIRLDGTDARRRLATEEMEKFVDYLTNLQSSPSCSSA